MLNTIEAANLDQADMRALSVDDVATVSGARMKLVTAVPPILPPDPHSGGATGYTLVFWKQIIAGSLTP